MRSLATCGPALASLWSFAILQCAATSAARPEVAGITEPVKDETLSALVAGKIAAIHFEEGQFVEQGEIVVDLDKTLDKLEVARRRIIWESKAELQAAEAKTVTLKAELEGTRRVRETTKSISLEELNRAQLDYELASADVQQLRLAEEREQIEYQMAQEQLHLREIRTPISGILARVLREVGENCQPHEPLFRIVDIRQCYLVVNMEAPLTYRLQVGQKVPLRIQAERESVSVQGVVTFISPVVDPASGLQEVKAVFENPGNGIHPGVPGIMVVPPPADPP